MYHVHTNPIWPCTCVHMHKNKQKGNPTLWSCAIPPTMEVILTRLSVHRCQGDAYRKEFMHSILMTTFQCTAEVTWTHSDVSSYKTTCTVAQCSPCAAWLLEACLSGQWFYHTCVSSRDLKYGDESLEVSGKGQGRGSRYIFFFFNKPHMHEAVCWRPGLMSCSSLLITLVGYMPTLQAGEPAGSIWSDILG